MSIILAIESDFVIEVAERIITVGTERREVSIPHTCYRCVVIFTKTGCRCGYVGIRKEHPLWGVSYYAQSHVLREKTATRDSWLCPDVYFNIHGAITFSDCNVPGLGSTHPGISDRQRWWYGFDCNHLGDAPDFPSLERYCNDQQLFRTLSRTAEITRGYEYGIVRDKEYCIDECRRLVDQLERVRVEELHRNNPDLRSDLITNYNLQFGLIVRMRHQLEE